MATDVVWQMGRTDWHFWSSLLPSTLYNTLMCCSIKILIKYWQTMWSLIVIAIITLKLYWYFYILYEHPHDVLLTKKNCIWTLLFLAVQNSSIGDLVNIFYILCVPQQTLWSLIYIKPLLLGSKKSNSYKQNSSNLYIFGWFCIRINVFNDDEMVECISIPTDLVCWVMNHDDSWWF